MLGRIKVGRRDLDSTMIPVSTKLMVDKYGREYIVIEDTKIPRQSKFTRAMLRMTYGVWPWGKTVAVRAIREDRNVKR